MIAGTVRSDRRRPQIAVLDVGLGNLHSVVNAFAECGLDAMVVNTPEALDDASHLVLPGVGAFAAGMHGLLAGPLHDRLLASVAEGRPLLGLCLGMQLLASRGVEGGDTLGLGLVPGSVRHLGDLPGRRLPHMGWNSLEVRRPHPVLEGIKQGRDVYFVHSYGFYCDDEDDVLAETDYETPVAAIVGRNNVIGTQFHPEKSQVSGLRLLENFAHWDGTL